jgi:hypothetical protein
MIDEKPNESLELTGERPSESGRQADKSCPVDLLRACSSTLRCVVK